MRKKRTKIWIDRFQTLLSVRIGLYILLCQVLVWILLGLWEHFAPAADSVAGESLLTSGLFRGLLVMVCLTPLLTLDAVKFAHRLVGPLYRFRKTIQAIGADEPVGMVRLRKGDLLQELKDDMNQMLQLLEQKGYVVLEPPALAENAGKAPAAGLAGSVLPTQVNDRPHPVNKVEFSRPACSTSDS